jgi:hypothetical protein
MMRRGATRCCSTLCCSTPLQHAAAASQHGTAYGGGAQTCASRFATAALSSTQPHASIAAVSSSPPASPQCGHGAAGELGGLGLMFKNLGLWVSGFGV